MSWRTGYCVITGGSGYRPNNRFKQLGVGIRSVQTFIALGVGNRFMREKNDKQFDVARSGESPPHPAMSDSALAAWLEERRCMGRRIAYAYAKHYFKVFELQNKSSVLISGDLGTESVKELRKLAKKKLLNRIELPVEEIEAAEFSHTSWSLLESEPTDIAALKQERDRLFSRGRGKAIAKSTIAKVWYDAAGRCMYRGCGCELGETALTTTIAPAAYLAHIVASDPDGPRGCEESHALSDSPENIMLMCDAHHRLIDRIDVAGHSRQRLEGMREEHSVRVKALLEGLRYPRAQVMTLLADLGQVSTSASQSELFDSVLSRNLGPLPAVKHMVKRTQRDDRSRRGFWSHFLHEHESDIRELIAAASNRASQIAGTSSDVLAIFPLHLVPVLVLAGRIIGEARNVEIFQYDRDRRTWQWKDPESARKASFGLSQVEAAADLDAKEAVLSIELTAEIDQNCIPSELRNAIDDQLIGWVRIVNRQPSHSCISTKDDLERFADQARQAVRIIHDTWRSTKVHVFGISPASTLFRLGQLLQAGNHPTYHIYDRPDGSSIFEPALEITGNYVAPANTEHGSTPVIDLR